jgi:hypothetical protein
MTFAFFSAAAHAEIFTPPKAECAALQAKYPQFKGKALRGRERSGQRGSDRDRFCGATLTGLPTAQARRGWLRP